MTRFSEKQLMLMTIGVPALLVAGFGALIYMDWQEIHAAEITPDNPEAADIANEEEWGENRKIYELQLKIDAAQAEADLIPKREEDVIVYREIVNRDAAILPSFDDVNRIATTIGEFERLANVRVTRVSDLNLTANAGGQAIRRMPIKLRLSGSFDEFLKFVNLFENLDRMVNTESFSITAGQVSGEGRDAKAEHTISLDLVTFIYNAGAGIAQPVEIAGYDRRKQAPEIQQAIRQKKAAQVLKYQLKPRVNRRDPCVDPRRSRDEVPDEMDAKAFEDQKKLVDKLKFAVELLKEDVRQEAAYVQERKYVPLAQLRPLIDAKVSELQLEITQASAQVTVPELAEVFHDYVVEPFEAIKAERQMAELPLTMGRSKVQEFVEQARGRMELGEYEGVVQTHREFLGLVKGLEVHPDAEPYVEELEMFAHEANVMLDFERLDLRVSGLILRADGSRVLIGGKSRKVGDFVDPDGRCRLISISKDALVYELDGTQIEKSLRDD